MFTPVAFLLIEGLDLGAGGLGTRVVSAVTDLDIAYGFEGGPAVVILAIVLDRFTAAPAERPGRGLRLRLPAPAREAAVRLTPSEA